MLPLALPNTRSAPQSGRTCTPPQAHPFEATPAGTEAGGERWYILAAAAAALLLLTSLF